jgi:hypothetical protein
VEAITTYIYFFALIAAIIVGFLFILLYPLKTHLSTLALYLIYILLIERIGIYLVTQKIHNAWLYNYSSLLEFIYFIWLISKMYILKSNNKKLYILSTIYCTMALINIIFFQGKKGFHSITYGLGSLILITVCIYYFYQLLLFPSTKKLTKQPQFWICTALLFYNCCSFPIFCLNNFYYSKVSEQIWPIISVTSNIINTVLYLLFIVAFLCNLNITKYYNQLFLSRKVAKVHKNSLLR